MSLAAWKYRHAMADLGGPIERLALREQEITPGVRGYEALAYLRADLRSPGEAHAIYGHADGTGSARLRHVASHIAISEALERWAFYSLQGSNQAKQFCFDLEPSTTGMAAFPGLFKRTVAGAARREAIERWSVCRWWEGGLFARPLYTRFDEILAIEVTTPWPEVSTVIVWGQSPATKLYSYGFAAGENTNIAVGRALIERTRNLIVLDKYAEGEGRAAATGKPSLLLLQEQRLFHFASEQGHAAFIECVEKSKVVKSTRLQIPTVLVDAEIGGDWSVYATVWRCLFQFESGRHLEENPKYFLF